MHSSRAAFSSLHTQQGLGFAVALSVVVVGLLEAARLLIWRGSEAGDGFGLVMGWNEMDGRLGVLVAAWEDIVNFLWRFGCCECAWR